MEARAKDRNPRGSYMPTMAHAACAREAGPGGFHHPMVAQQGRAAGIRREPPRDPEITIDKNGKSALHRTGLQVREMGGA